MKINFKEVLTPTITLFVICLITAVLLAGTNLMTRDKIVEINKQTESASRQLVLPAAKNFEDSRDGTYAIGKNGSELTGYVFTTKTKSYGVVLLSISDTPGLGLNAEKESFRDQYKKTAPEKGFEVIKSGSPKDGQIEAMTGATITSKAVTKCVNEAIEEYQKVKGGE